MGLFDNMRDRPISSSRWAEYEISGEIDQDALSINIGVLTVGKARAWVDSVSFEVVPQNPPTAEETELREHFQKLYAQFDAAQQAGAVEQIIALAFPDARIHTVAGPQPLHAALDGLKQELSKGTKIVPWTTVSRVRLSADTAVVSTDEEATVTTADGSQKFTGRSQDTWVKTAAGWRIKESMKVSFRPVVPRSDPESVKPVLAELKQRATPLTTTEAGKPMDDLAAFGKAVGDARIVSLGEASHGTREFFQMKHRLLEYLVLNRGFTVFAIEANWPETLAVDRYIKTGAGDVESAMKQMYFWTWNTEEVRDMIEWMRKFNQAPGEHPTLTFTSFDMQTGRVAARQALDYLKRYSPADASIAEANLDVAALDGVQSDSRATGASERVAAVVAIFDSKREEMERASSREAWRNARQAAAIAYQACSMRIPGKGSGYRDEMLAANVEWLLKEVHPKEKIVLWAHNGHVRFGMTGSFKSMGTWLRERFGRDMYVAGFVFRRGEVRAIGMGGGTRSPLSNHPVAPAPEGTGAAVLSAAGMPLFFLDMAALPARSPLSQWLGREQLFYNPGAVWMTDNPESNLSPTALSKAYDGAIFVEEGHAARGLSMQR